MNFPTWQIGAAAAGVLIPSLVLLYFLKLRRRDVEVSTTLLWKQSIRDLQANAPFQRLRKNILLLLQLLALIGGALAVAQPEMLTNESPGKRSVILIDRSASMAATDEREDGAAASRLEKAKAEALRFVGTLREPDVFGGEADEAMVIAFDSAAEVVQPYTTDKARLRRAIEGIEGGDAGTAMDEAARLAGAYQAPIVVEGRGLVMQPGPPMHIWSDGAIADLAGITITPGTPVRYHAMGKAETWNAGITALRAERAFDDPTRLSVFVSVQSTEQKPREIDVELLVEGVGAGVRAVSLPAATAEGPAVGGVVFRLERPEAGIVAARLAVDDALAADNLARLVVPPARRVSVALVTRGSLFLKEALAGLPLARLEVIAPEEFQKRIDAGKAAEFDVVVCDAWAPTLVESAVRKGGKALPGGRWLILGAAPAVRGVTPGDAPEKPEPAVALDWSRDHPALRLITLDGLVVNRPLRAAVTEDVKTLAMGSSGPLIIEAAEGASRAIVTLFNPAESNWPFDVSFVLFLASSVNSLGDAGGLEELQASPGSVLSTELPRGASDVRIEQPGGAESPLAMDATGRVSFGPARRAGLYTVSWKGEPGPTDAVIDGRPRRVFAVNLLDAAESRIEARESLGLPSGDVAAAAGGEGGASRRLWRWLLLGAAGVVLVEWLVYNRRVRL